MENLTNDTPPKKGFWTPPRTVRFPPPSGVSALFFLYKNLRQSRPEALLEGSKNFRESAFSGTFSSPHTFCTPPYHGPISFLEMFSGCQIHQICPQNILRELYSCKTSVSDDRGRPREDLSKRLFRRDLFHLASQCFRKSQDYCGCQASC